jgi:hypothetical protein
MPLFVFGYRDCPDKMIYKEDNFANSLMFAIFV